MTPRPDRDDVTAVILCGGRSRRFGEDKALVRLGGIPLLDRVIAAVETASSEIRLATGNEPRYADRGLPIVTDRKPGLGPLAGIVAGLSASSRRCFLITAVDLPLVTAEAVDALLVALGSNELVMPRTDRGLEPLFSAGLRAPFLAAAERRLLSDIPAPHRLAEDVQTLLLDTGEPALRRAVRNINTPEDLARAERDIQRGLCP